MPAVRPYAVSIAGFDPSAGAGVLADIKTFECNGVYGFGVCSVITWQNDNAFERAEWLNAEKIISQVEVLRKRFDFKWLKIGLIESLDALEEVVQYLKKDHEVNIVWDPILKASAGFEFHGNIEKKKLEAICSNLYLITPNRPEALRLIPAFTAEESAEQLSAYCNVLLKGGHSDEARAKDILYTKESVYAFDHERLENAAKHGSGCVLSAAVTSSLAKGHTLEEACAEGKKYVTGFLKSNESLLGYHSVVEKEYA